MRPRGCARVLMAALAGWMAGAAALAESAAREGATRMPAKKWPEVSGVVMSRGKADTSKPKLESAARAFSEQAEAEKSGAPERIQEIGRRTSSVFAEVFGQPRPVPHAVVTLLSLPEPTEKGRTVTADAEGKFEFFDTGQGPYRIVAQDPRQGTKGGASAEMTVEHDRTREHVRIVIHPETVTVKGRVTGSQGQPLTNVTVSARQGHERYVPTEGDFTRAYHETTALTDSAGRYELRGLAPAGLWEAGGFEGGGYGGADAWYTVTISAPGYAPAKAYVPVVPEETRRAARTLSGLLKGLASAHAKAGRRVSQPVAQPPCQGHTLIGVDFVLHKSARVEGSFADKGGPSQPGCTVLLSLTNSADACSYQAFTESSHYARCDAEGRFRFDGVAPGAYKVQVYEDHRLVSGKPPRVVTVIEGEPVTGLRLVKDAQPCGKIVGVVSDAASGKPVKGVTVYSVHKETGSSECPAFLCLCGKSGYHTAECARWIERAIQTNDLRVSTFVVEKAAPGPTELVLKAPEYAEERVSIDVAPEGVARPEIKLWRAGTARIRPGIESGARVGYYASVQGNPPLVHYVAVPETGGPCVRGGSPSRQQAGCDEFAGLKPGRYTLRGDICYMRGNVTRFETVPLEIASGQSSEAELDFSGTCEIMLEVDFAPGTAVSVLLETAGTPAGQKAESNLGLKANAYLREPGSVLIPDLKPDAYRLSLFRRDVSEKKGAAEKKEPDEVKTVTLVEGRASQTFSFRF